MTIHKDLFEIADRLAAAAVAGRDASVQTPLSALDAAADTVGQASSGSWLGYHSRIYYANFQEPLPGAHFSQEWGLMSTFDEEGTRGDWREYRPEQVKEYVEALAGHPICPKRQIWLPKPGRRSYRPRRKSRRSCGRNWSPGRTTSWKPRVITFATRIRSPHPKWSRFSRRRAW